MAAQDSFTTMVNMVATIKLTKMNYLPWRRQIVVMADCFDLMGLLDSSSAMPSPTVTSAAGESTVNPTYMPWRQEDRQLRIVISTSLSDDAYSEIIDASTSRDMWFTLETVYSSVSRQHQSMATENSTNTSRAEELKILANDAFKTHKYSQAIDLYTQAIEVHNDNAVYWANRAFAYTKLEEYGSAILDATKAIEIDPKYSKGYYRRGAAHLEMGKFKEALKDFQQVKRICPNDPDATRKLKECEKAVMKLKFEEPNLLPLRPVDSSVEEYGCRVLPQMHFHQNSASFLPHIKLLPSSFNESELSIGHYSKLNDAKNTATGGLSLSHPKNFSGKTLCSAGVCTYPGGAIESHAHATDGKIGVLLLNLGGPEALQDVQPFLFNLFADPDIIRLPRMFRFLQCPPVQLVSVLRAPKSKEGYASPLRKITDEQPRALKFALEAKGVTTASVHPIKRDRITRFVVLPLSPQFSISTTGSGIRVLRDMLRVDSHLSKLPVAIIQSWYQRKGYITSIADFIEKELQNFSNPEEAMIFFSAHGVLVSYVEDTGDPYRDQMDECIFLIMQELKVRGIMNDHTLAYQNRVGPVQWFTSSRLRVSTFQALRLSSSHAALDGG